MCFDALTREDWKNISGLIPVSQQILGVCELFSALYEIALIVYGVTLSYFEPAPVNYADIHHDAPKKLTTCEKLIEPLKGIGGSILRATPLVGTAYSGYLLALEHCSCFNYDKIEQLIPLDN